MKAVIRQACETFTRQAFSSNKPKEVWRIIHRILKPNQQPLGQDPNKLNSFFACTAERTLPVSSDLPFCLEELIESLPDDSPANFKLRKVSHGEVLRMLKLLRSDTSTGPDGIPVKFVKMVADSIADPLTAIINNCIRKYYFPKAWKNARISPIPKVDQPKSEEHFRPISILRTLSKVFEKFVMLQITTFCESESVLRDTIFSFRKGHSTNTVVMGMHDDLPRAVKKGEVTLMVLADFSEAFGTVNYKVLITKLSTLGFSELFLRWFKSYLSERSHFVQIDDLTSESVNTRFDVPQGSILGSMLFNLYVSDLQDHLPSSIGSFQYADDTTIYSSCPAPELERCVQEVNSTLNTVSSWTNDSHIALNSKKTKTMLLSTSQMSHVHSLGKNQPAITISDSTLEYVNVSKLLGVHFHQHFNWDEHVQAT